MQNITNFVKARVLLLGLEFFAKHFVPGADIRLPDHDKWAGNIG
jgi:hypothetical protein